MFTIIGLSAAAAAATALTSYLLLRRRRRRQERERQQARASQDARQRQEDASWSERRRQRRAEEEAAAAERQRQRDDAAARKAQEALAGQPELSDLVQRQTGLSRQTLQDVSASRDAALRVAQALGPELLHIIWLAAHQRDIEFDLDAVVEREPVNYPSHDIEPEQMTGLDQLAAIMPEQLAMEDEPFYRQLAESQLLVMQAYEFRSRRKRLYILLDVSGSMKGPMADGQSRHVWARGVTVNLLLKAIRGEADYLLRGFDGQPHGLHQVNDRASAEKLMDHILRFGFSGGDTNIYAAFRAAVNDIRSRGDQTVGTSEILIISDGEDRSMDNTAEVRRLLGSDIKLHACLIGVESPALQAVADSYRVMV